MGIFWLNWIRKSSPPFKWGLILNIHVFIKTIRQNAPCWKHPVNIIHRLISNIEQNNKAYFIKHSSPNITSMLINSFLELDYHTLLVCLTVYWDPKTSNRRPATCSICWERYTFASRSRVICRLDTCKEVWRCDGGGILFLIFSGGAHGQSNSRMGRFKGKQLLPRSITNRNSYVPR